jgi:large subunit ribosomal protein L24
MAKMKIKTGDTVRVLTGKDKGKEGRVMSVDMNSQRVLVEGVNMATKHAKPSATNQNGGIMHQESPIHVSNVAYVLKGATTKIGTKIEQEERNGKMKSVKYRVAKSTGEVIN